MQRRAPRETPLGKTLIIANPVSQLGQGKRVAEQLWRFLSLYHHDPERFELVYTERARHATELAEAAADFDSVIALGGDGVVHEVVNGLMHIDRDARPAMGVVPVGSGNDFARTLGMDDFSGESSARYLNCERVAFDIGKLSLWDNAADAEGAARSSTPDAIEYFVETFSFGLDAAVAMGTYSLRTTTKLTGNALYMASGADVLLRKFRPYPTRISLDGGAPEERRTFIGAVQLGPTYGSGFYICPGADPTDGLFDICLASGRATRVEALSLLLRAKNAHHVGSRLISFAQASHIDIEFLGEDYPMQADGEQVRAAHVVIDILPGELTVLKPLSRR
ncbi:YegS/Rv2252/BmrU family lipid kinase [Enorma sp.]|uniref:diacylglycerol/lipid kinase family protein n=1 Tax=Enorma sp. TaxID=1920692 RepID=UPI0025C6E35E|nr:YegS/Rv2252/BmrU family lipid kinase [Enorma sp.]